MKVNLMNSDWIYEFQNLETESRKVQFEQVEGDFKVKIPFAGFSEGIEIQIHLTPQSHHLSGNYKIVPTGTSDGIEGEILNDGACLEIYPQGFNQRKIWVFRCMTPIKTSTQSTDFCNIS